MEKWFKCSVVSVALVCLFATTNVLAAQTPSSNDEQDPQIAAATYFKRGSAYFDLEQYQNAINTISQAIELAPENAVYYFKRADAYDKLGQHQKATSDYNRAMELRSQSIDNKTAGVAPLPKQSEQIISDQGQIAPSNAKPLYKRLMNRAYFWRLRYYFVAQNTANCDVLYGLVQDDPLIGFASVDFSFPNGCECHGHALATHYPANAGFSCAGEEGWIKAKCSDGRYIDGRFTTTSLTTGYANVSDTLGNQYQASFGHSAGEAVAKVNAIRRQLHCPECSVRGVDLVVQGKILRAD